MVDHQKFHGPFILRQLKPELLHGGHQPRERPNGGTVPWLQTTTPKRSQRQNRPGTGGFLRAVRPCTTLRWAKLAPLLLTRGDDTEGGLLPDQGQCVSNLLQLHDGARGAGTRIHATAPNDGTSRHRQSLT